MYFQKARSESMNMIREVSDARSDVSNNVSASLNKLDDRLGQVKDDVQRIQTDRDHKYAQLADMIQGWTVIKV